MAARLACLALCCCALALGSCGAASRGATSTPRAAACHPAGAKTVLANSIARVFTRSGSVYGCSERTGRVTRLGRVNVCIGTPRAGPFALAADLAAYGLETCGVDTGSSEVLVRRLSDGKRLRTEAAITGPVGPESYGSVRSIVARSDHAVGWIAVSNSIVGHSSVTEVHRADSHGRALLDSGAAIDPASLRLHGSLMSWRHGHATRSARLA